MNMLNRLYLKAKIRSKGLRNDIKEFMSSEKGISNIVATIILVLIVVILIGIFWDKLSDWLSGMMNSIFGSDVPSSGDMTVN